MHRLCIQIDSVCDARELLKICWATLLLLIYTGPSSFTFSWYDRGYVVTAQAGTSGASEAARAYMGGLWSVTLVGGAGLGERSPLKLKFF